MPPLRECTATRSSIPAPASRASCPFVYSYEGWGHTYVGCMQKIYDVEIDVDMLRAAERRQAGFGAIRAVRQPLPMCKAEVEQTYASRARGHGLRQPGVRRAAGRDADVPRLRAGPASALRRGEQRFLAPAAEAARERARASAEQQTSGAPSASA